MSNDLVRRLACPYPKDEDVEEVTLPVWVILLTTEAADRIEELKKERDTYFAERNKFQLYLQRTHADWELEVAAVDGLNAKLAKAVELVEEAYCEGFAEGHAGGWIEGDYSKPWKKSALFATLAELKGQDDD